MFGRGIKKLLGQKTPSRGIQVNSLLKMIEDKMYELEKESIVKEFNDFDDVYEFILTDGSIVLVSVDA